MPKRVMGIDPSLANTAWVILESEGRSVRYISHGMASHGVRGRGKWAEKIGRILVSMENTWDNSLDTVIVEKPHYGSRGRNQASSVALMAVMDLAWQIVWTAHDYTENVFALTSDNKTKAQRSHLLPGLIQDWPKITNEHVRDAAWIALKGC